MKPPLIKDRPFIEQSALTGRWYFIESWRDLGNGVREAWIKHDITDSINRIIADAKDKP